MPPMSEIEQAGRVLDSMDGLPVLVLGDVMLDRYLWGDTSRISPEAPVPVIEAREETCRLGGAANVARNVRALGGRPWLVGIVGDDSAGQDLRREIAGNGIAADRIFTDTSRRTTTKTRVVARHQQVVRVDREDIARDRGRRARTGSRCGADRGPRGGGRRHLRLRQGDDRGLPSPRSPRGDASTGDSGLRRPEGNALLRLPGRDGPHPEPRRGRRRLRPQDPGSRDAA